MSTSTLAHDAFAPRRPPGMRSGLALAILAHVLLIAALAWSVQWKTSEPEGVVAELWSALPQIAAPRPSVAIPPAPVVVAKPPPAPAPEPVKSPRVDAQIAVEQAKRQEAERLEAARQAEAARREQARRDDAEREAEKKKLAEKARQDAAQQAAIREANLRHMMSQAGSSDDPAATGTAARTSGPSASYAGRIKARIKPNIVLTGNVDGNPLATVQVWLAPDGTIIRSKLTKSSGSPVWDETVLRAIDKTEKLPQDIDGRVPASMSIDFKPQE
jgi:colicin import membrane protein